MSNAVVPYEQLNTMAVAFAKSGMFGAKTPEQALSLLLLAQAEGVHPAIAMRDFDIIQGRPAKKAEAMHRSFLAAGGSITWHKLDDTIADATFSHPAGGTARISWDMARAQKAGLKNKDMYSKYPRQMLKARVISEGCRTVFPAATSGLYVPEEVSQFTPAKPAPQPEKDMGAAHVVDEVDETQRIPGVGMDAAPEQAAAPAGETPPDTAIPPAAPAGAAPLYITPEQVGALSQMFEECDQYAKAKFLSIAKIKSLSELPSGDYDEAVDWIKRRRAKHGKAA